MNNYRYIPIKKNVHGNSYVFPVELAQKGNGDWVAWIATLPGCAAWGYSKDDALHALSAMARVYCRRLIERGVHMPEEVATVNTPIVAVTLSLFFLAAWVYDDKDFSGIWIRGDPEMQTP